MYGVFENNKPCDNKNHKVHPSWNNSVFETWDQALRYAYKWLGQFADAVKMEGPALEVNVPYDYSGYGDMIEIRKI